MERIRRVRNIGISAHIDSGKTTLTERILYYTGRIREIHEIKSEVGSKMDSMELERQRGITIQSAATYCSWNNHHINIIDTPGHVDFTIEVERALRVLDGAVLVLCSVGGVQSQTMTVDRQMKRYNVPRIVFINKCDRTGADPWRVIRDFRHKLRHNAAAVQIPIGLESEIEGVVDIIDMRAVKFDGERGQRVIVEEVPANLMDQAKAKRQELIERLADVDEEIGELFLAEADISAKQLKDAIRRCTIARTFIPVFMGSAYKNKGVQALLDGVLDYLPNPAEVENKALDTANNEAPVALTADSSLPLVALAFKLQEEKFGQLTYMRVYQGTLRKGDFIHNIAKGSKVKVPRLVRMHSNDMEDIQECGSGEIVAMFGIECSTGDTFTDGKVKYAMTSMHVPDAVMSLAIAPKSKDCAANFSKALSRFMREDPTFRVRYDNESKQTIISGMGELHLEIYVERMKREYNVETIVGQPQVSYRETISQKANFNYTHKKQSGGAGQYARVIGRCEPLGYDQPCEFVNNVVGNAIPPAFLPACEKGFAEAAQKGPLVGMPVQGVRTELLDGLAHAVDSSELAFKIACIYAFKQAFDHGDPVVLEPLMNVEITVPTEFQGPVIASLNKRKGTILGSEEQDGATCVRSEVPLSQMFGYSTDLRSLTQGKGEFTMEYNRHAPVARNIQQELMEAYQKKRKEGSTDEY